MQVVQAVVAQLVLAVSEEGAAMKDQEHNRGQAVVVPVTPEALVVWVATLTQTDLLEV